MNKISYKVELIPNKEAMKLSNLMSSLDLNIDYISTNHVFSLETITDIDDAYIEKMKTAIIKSVESIGGEVINIELIEAVTITK